MQRIKGCRVKTDVTASALPLHFKCQFWIWVKAPKLSHGPESCLFAVTGIKEQNSLPF